MLVDQVSVKEHMLHIIKIIREGDEYLGKVIDAVFQFPIDHQEALVAYFMDAIGQEQWEPLAEDSMMYPEFFKVLLVFFSGRKKVGKEPDRFQLMELLEGYLESKHCHDIVDEDSKEKLAEMIGELG